MKVCVLTPKFSRYKGEVDNLYALNKYLAKKVDIELITPNDTNTKNYDEFDKIKIHRFNYFFPKSLHRVSYGGGIVDNLKKSGLAKFQFPFFLLSFLLKTLKIAKKCDVIHAHWIFTGLIAIIAKKIYGKKVILTLRNPQLKDYPKFFAKFVTRNVDAIISPHDELAEKARNLSGKEVIEIPNMVDEDLFGNKKDAKDIIKEFKITQKHTVLFLARLDEMKDPMTFVNAAKEFSKQKDTLFIIVGWGPLEEKLRQLIKEKNLSNVLMTGKRNDVHKFYAFADVYCALSPIENMWSRSIVESLVAKVPCIITKAGDTEKFFKNKQNAILIDSKSPKQLANAIKLLLKDKKLRNKIIKNAYNLAKSRKVFKKDVIGNTLKVYGIK